MSRNFRELLDKQWEQGKFLCIGLDSDFEKIPEVARQAGTRETIVAFNRAIIDATHDLVCAFKPNPAFYEAHGDEGWKALRETIQYIRDQAPEVPIILDAKRGDIGNTNNGYVESVFDHLHVDAVTVHPYLGGETLTSFFDRKDKGIFILCRTSNPGAAEFQDLVFDGKALFKIVAEHVADRWNENSNCGVVAGATYPDELREVRAIIGDMPILIPGIGTQGGDLKKTVAAAKDSRGQGMIIVASRSIIFASSGKDFAVTAREKAEELHGEIMKAV